MDEFLTSISKLQLDKLRQDRQRQRELERRVAELRSRSQLPVKRDQRVSSTDPGTEERASLGMPPEIKFTRLMEGSRYSPITIDDDDDELAPPLPTRRDELPPPLPKRKSKGEHPPKLPKRKPFIKAMNEEEEEEDDEEEEEEEEEYEENAPILPPRRGLSTPLSESTFMEDQEEAPPLPTRRNVSGGQRKPLGPTRKPPPKPTRKSSGTTEGRHSADGNRLPISKHESRPKVGVPTFSGSSLLSQWKPPTKVIQAPNERKQPPRLFVDMEKELRDGQITIASVNKLVLGSVFLDNQLIKSVSGSINLALSLDLPPPKPKRKPTLGKPERQDDADKPEVESQATPPRAPKPNALKSWQPPAHLAEQSISIPDTRRTSPTKGWMASLSSNPKTERHQYDAGFTENTRSPKKGWMSSLATNPKTEHTTQVPITIARLPTKLSWMSLLSANSATTSHHQFSLPASRSPSRSPTRGGAWLMLATRQASEAAPQSRVESTSVPKSPTKALWIDLALSKGEAYHYDEMKPNFEIKKVSKKEELEEEKAPRVPEFLQTKLRKSPEKIQSAVSVPLGDVPAMGQLQKLKSAKPAPPKNPKPTSEDNEVLQKMQTLGKRKPPPQKAAKPDNKEAEMLSNTIKKLSRREPELLQKNDKYHEADAAEVRKQMTRLGKLSLVKQQPERVKETAEGLAALSKLKPAVPVKPEKPPPVEAVAKLNNLKHKELPLPTAKKFDKEETIKVALKHKPLPSKKKVEKSPEPDFKSQLGSILKQGRPSALPNKSSSDLSASSPKLGMNLKRSNTSSSTKLEHTTKLRAKGPKRRLPKLATSENISEKLPNVGLRKVSTDSSLAKKPPPLPAKKKPVVESRQFSGEVFI